MPECDGMSDIEPRRSGSGLSRKQREQRAYRLVVTGGTAAIVAVVGAILAAIDIIGGTLPLLAAALAILCFVLLRRTIRR